jgi:3-oxoadipate enol-lactonase
MIVKANGIQIHYEISGKKEGPVVVLSHSLSASLNMWDPQMAALEPRFQVLRYDTRGHGGTEVTHGAYSLEMLGEDAIGLLDALRIDTVHWIGLSMGGMIGQCLALNHARRLRSLALCDTGSVVPKESQPLWDERIAAARNQGMAALVEATMERWFTPSFLQKKSPMAVQIREQFLATSPQGYIGCAEAIRRVNYLNRLAEIKIATLIVVGEDDQGTPVAASQAMNERIRGSKLVVLPLARHLSNVEQPEAFNAALLQFLQSL